MRLKTMNSCITTMLLVVSSVSIAIAEGTFEARLKSQGQSAEVIRQLQGLSALIMERKSAKDRRGVRVLLVDPRNAAQVKTAHILASNVGMTLYQIDLASVVGKYIGETEKNLNRVLARAEKNNMILFFDEADELFGKRAGGIEAHQRYALQRIESYKGVVIVSSRQHQQLPITRFDTKILLSSSPTFGRNSSSGRKAIGNSM